VVFLSSRKAEKIDMDRLEMIISTLNYSLETKRKRHLVGGVLLSVSLFFGGLAFTIISLKQEEDEDE
jgi:hypothetical protein